MEKNTEILSIYPQDSPINIAGIIRERDPKVKIYPVSALVTNSKDYFTKKELNYIYEKQKKLFSINFRLPRTIVVRSTVLNQEDIFSILYTAQNNPYY